MAETTRHGKDGASGIAEKIRPGALFRKLIRTFASGSAVHAWLFTGPEGVGKRTLAAQCAMAALCRGEEKPCFHCPPCVRILDGMHPDVIRISGGKTIGVDAIREAVRLTAEHAFEGGRRVILMENAAKMTVQAQNCLLKTLEEPAGDTLFLLTAEDTSSLLPTVVSRCRQVPIPLWMDEEMIPILLQNGASADQAAALCFASGGSLGLALKLKRDPKYGALRENVLHTVFSMESAKDVFPIGAAMREEKDQAEDYLSAVEGLLREVLLRRLGLAKENALEGFPERWRWAGENAPVASFQRMLCAVFEARRQRASQVSWQAVLETFLLTITEEIKTWQQ